ncbi:hypothetical protein GCM10011428_51910 [Streptomyces violaceus]
MIGDGEAETGPLAGSWHANKFLDPVHDGAVLPILHLNGYKIANPTVLSRIRRRNSTRSCAATDTSPSTSAATTRPPSTARWPTPWTPRSTASPRHSAPPAIRAWPNARGGR